jgi:hypothetical protein
MPLARRSRPQRAPGHRQGLLCAKAKAMHQYAGFLVKLMTVGRGSRWLRFRATEENIARQMAKLLEERERETATRRKKRKVDP